MSKLKKYDDVIIIAGKNKGCRGTIIKICFKSERVLIEGMNLVKKHIKPNPKKGIEGGIIKKESFIHISNVTLYNNSRKKKYINKYEKYKKK